MRPSRYCLAPGCKNNNTRRDISFHNIPKDKNLRVQWLVNIDRPNWDGKPCLLLCSEHFTKDCFEKNPDALNSLRNSFKPIKIRLKASAIPTIFNYNLLNQSQGLVNQFTLNGESECALGTDQDRSRATIENPAPLIQNLNQSTTSEIITSNGLVYQSERSSCTNEPKRKKVLAFVAKNSNFRSKSTQVYYSTFRKNSSSQTLVKTRDFGTQTAALPATRDKVVQTIDGSGTNIKAPKYPIGIGQPNVEK